MNTHTPQSQLAESLEAARTLPINETRARAFVAALPKAQRVAAYPLRHKLVFVWAGAATFACLLLLLTRAEETPASVARLGQRVAVSTHAATTYQVLTQTSEVTHLLVESGSLSVRLFSGHTKHQLKVQANNLIASATGTVYTVEKQGDTVRIVVHEGTVQLDGPGVHVSLDAKKAWQDGEVLQASEVIAAAHLLATLRPNQNTEDTQAASAAPPAHVLPSTAKPSAPPALVVVRDDAALWREARLQIGQGEYQKASALLDEVVQRKSATWAPIALAELVRLHTGPLSQPAQALALGEDFLRKFPNHPLERDLQNLLCEAARQGGVERGGCQ